MKLDCMGRYSDGGTNVAYNARKETCVAWRLCDAIAVAVCASVRRSGSFAKCHTYITES